MLHTAKKHHFGTFFLTLVTKDKVEGEKVENTEFRR